MKKYLSGLLAVLLLFALAGCKPIEDTNGEADKTLVTLTGERLKTISGSIKMGSSKKSGSPTVQRYEDAGGFSDEEYDYDNIAFTFTRLNGTQKAMIAYLTQGEKMTVTFSSSITAGNFGAVLLSPGRSSILESFAADEEKTVTITAEEEGDYLLVIAGESCDGSLEIVRTFS